MHTVSPLIGADIAFIYDIHYMNCMDFHLGPVVLCDFLLWFKVFFLQNYIGEKRIHKHFNHYILNAATFTMNLLELWVLELLLSSLLCCFLFETLSHRKALVGLSC